MIAFAIAGGKEHHYPWMAEWFLPYLGISISALVLLSIAAALEAMRILRREEFELIRDSEELKGVPFGRMPRFLHWLGMASAAVVPLIFVMAWVLALRHS